MNEQRCLPCSYTLSQQIVISFLDEVTLALRQFRHQLPRVHHIPFYQLVVAMEERFCFRATFDVLFEPISPNRECRVAVMSLLKPDALALACALSPILRQWRMMSTEREGE